MPEQDAMIGREVVIPPAPHAGHTVTVVRRDIEKHKAYWLRCECGATAIVGEYWLPRILEGSEPIWNSRNSPLGLRP